jgi:hypothetical protein
MRGKRGARDSCVLRRGRRFSARQSGVWMAVFFACHFGDLAGMQVACWLAGQAGGFAVWMVTGWRYSVPQSNDPKETPL